MTCKENTSPPAGRNCGKPSEKTLAAIRKKNNQTTHSLLVSVFFLCEEHFESTRRLA
jgi:hypothetical protein